MTPVVLHNYIFIFVDVFVGVVVVGGGGGGGAPSHLKAALATLNDHKQPLRGTLLNRTYGTHRHHYICLLLLTTFGPIYYGPP